MRGFCLFCKSVQQSNGLKVSCMTREGKGKRTGVLRRYCKIMKAD